MVRQIFLRSSLLALLLCAALGSSAQRHRGGESDNRDGQRREMVERQAQGLSQRLALDEATARWFEPLYVEYADSLMKLRRTSMPSRDKKVDELPDEQAEEMLAAVFDADAQTLALKRRYCELFRQRLTVQQLLKVFAQPAGGRGQQRDGGGDFGPGRGGFPGGPGGFGPPPGGFGGPF